MSTTNRAHHLKGAQPDNASSEQTADYCIADKRIKLVAHQIVKTFDVYYIESRAIPYAAQAAFEHERHETTVQLSKQRLSMYSESIATVARQIQSTEPSLASDEERWQQVEAEYWSLISGRYEADLAYAYANSVRRVIFQDEWRPVDYAFRDPTKMPPGLIEEVYLAFPAAAMLETDTVREVLRIPRFNRAFEDLERDAERVALCINTRLGLSIDGDRHIDCLEMINAGFFRNRGAYVVGRILLNQGAPTPFIVAFLNHRDGIHVDAVLTRESDAHNLFSSTLANFHVTNSRYHELAAFLHTIMPNRPLGLHYSTIGFNHVGKVAVMNELKREMTRNNEPFMTSVGFRGTVAMGFASKSSAYNLKLIRDKPTDGYKWGKFGGVETVLDKYRRVHEINRTGSMLDNIIYNNLKLERRWFDSELLQELLAHCAHAVSVQDEAVVMKYLIVQRRMVPLPVFLETASDEDAERVIMNLGHCIKNNAAANIFNKDLDARNYGVGGFLKVYLYDYDALEPLTDVKIRSNIDRTDGEEDVPDWYFEDGVVFLPEEALVGLRIPSRRLRRLFIDVHGDLLTPQYWLAIQAALKADQVPAIRAYPQDCELVFGIDS